MRSILLSLFLVTSAAAQDTYSWAKSDSFISFHGTDAIGAVGAVTFKNTRIHVLDEDLNFDLTLGDMTVTILAKVGRGMEPDRFEVIPPDGFYAYPQFIDVPEDQEDTILIYPLVIG